ncbi:MAG: magnesium transporter CorA family protein [Chitinophagaceae bacterium]|jgi:magnesium transporter|nr:magnesium transporter CorA family protein [Chitinophagaceae bacterium]MCA6484607.1 magnesium transporter CorA family protein [Chitinophagaceae bacterium]MCA6487497.1 magnesium transporter CorA family protein [Chitinophagaceae bacterium]MCA6489337.1 magnesium transporter CorA family protein [Chitinophagaceae bacterium]MCA6494276.1 magnesium transporter CorA family protein [Chitinophagaceae bacterium]
MIQYFKTLDGQTIETDQAEKGVWVNLVPPFREEEFIDISHELNIPIEFLRDSLDIDERPRFEKEDEVKFVVIKTPTENNSFNDSDAFYITIPICIILTETQIVTVNSFDNGAIKKFLHTFQKRHPDQKNIMVLKVFEKVVQNFMEFLKEINHRRNHYENSLYESNSNEDLLNLMRIQKSLVYFVTALRSNELLMMKLERTNSLELNEEERELLNDLIIDTSQALEMANIYTNILTSTLDAFASVISNNLNSVMKRLTSITIILSLPALVAAIYGMNVDIPYMHSPHAFYIPVALSLGVSMLISWYFMKRKWF